MTNDEYSELKHKLVAKENDYVLWGIIIATGVSLVFELIITSLIEMKIASVFWCLFVLWAVSTGIVLGFNPWRKKAKELDFLFKSKASYEEAGKELNVHYEPPKN